MNNFKAVFNDEYYQQPDPDVVNNDPENEDDKPVFTDDEEEDLKCKLNLTL